MCVGLDVIDVMVRSSIPGLVACDKWAVETFRGDVRSKGGNKSDSGVKCIKK